MVWFKDDKHHELEPNELVLKWDRFNLTMDENAKVRISVWGYREDSVLPKLEYINMIYVTDIQSTSRP